MALTYCDNCGHRVSAAAPKCPSCGTPPPLLSLPSTKPTVTRWRKCVNCKRQTPRHKTVCDNCGFATTWLVTIARALAFGLFYTLCAAFILGGIVILLPLLVAVKVLAFFLPQDSRQQSYLNYAVKYELLSRVSPRMARRYAEYKEQEAMRRKRY